jgi:hypothetical protein
MQGKLVKAPAVAALLGITITHTRDLAREGKLPCSIEEDQSRPRYWFNLDEVLSAIKNDDRDLAKVNEQTRLVRVHELEALFNISAEQIRYLAHHNIIPSYVIGNSLWFNLDEVSGKMTAEVMSTPFR